jgi:hypothetical protein
MATDTCQRPEGIDGRELAGGKVKSISVVAREPGACIIDEVNGIDRLFLRIAIDAKDRAGHAIEVIILQEISRAEEIAGGNLTLVDLRFEGVKVSPCICYAVLHGLARLGRERVEINVLSRGDADARKLCS